MLTQRLGLDRNRRPLIMMHSTSTSGLSLVSRHLTTYTMKRTVLSPSVSVLFMFCSRFDRRVGDGVDAGVCLLRFDARGSCGSCGRCIVPHQSVRMQSVGDEE